MSRKNRIVKLNNGTGGEAEKVRRDLTPEQNMAVKLAALREQLKQKNVLISQLQQQHEASMKLAGERSVADTNRILELESKITMLTSELMQAQINAHTSESESALKDVGLEPKVTYQLDCETGGYYFEEEEAEDVGAQPVTDEGAKQDA